MIGWLSEAFKRFSSYRLNPVKRIHFGQSSEIHFRPTKKNGRINLTPGRSWKANAVALRWIWHSISWRKRTLKTDWQFIVREMLCKLELLLCLWCGLLTSGGKCHDDRLSWRHWWIYGSPQVDSFLDYAILCGRLSTKELLISFRSTIIN